MTVVQLFEMLQQNQVSMKITPARAGEPTPVVDIEMRPLMLRENIQVRGDISTIMLRDMEVHPGMTEAVLKEFFTALLKQLKG